jgi:hypothetical protein
VSNLETEEINLKVDYYNNPLGEVSEEVEGEIEDIKEGWLVKGEWIDIVDYVVRLSETICKTMQTWNTINAAWTGGVDLINDCCRAPWAAAACCPAKKATGKASSVSKESLTNIYKGPTFSKKGGLDRFCKVINCQMSRDSEDAEDPKNFWQKWVRFAEESSGSNRGYFGNVEPEDSIILSIILLCPKGVFHNLQKARQIDCRYAYCLEQTSDGTPVTLCVQQRSIAMCKYVFNQIFNFIPYGSVISDVSESVGDALANPWAAAEIALKATCRYAVCDIAGVGGCKACSILEFSSWLLETTCDLGISIGERDCAPFWETIMAPLSDDADYCEKIGVDE